MSYFWDTDFEPSKVSCKFIDILDLFPRPQVKDAKSLFTRRVWFYWIEHIYHGFFDIKSFDFLEHLISSFNDNQKIKFSFNYFINYFTILFPQKV